MSSGEDFHEATSGSLSRNPPAFSPGWPLWDAVSLWVISTVPTQPPPVHLMALSQVPWGATSYFEKAGHIKAEGWQLVGTDPTNKHMLRGTCKCKHEGMGWDGAIGGVQLFHLRLQASLGNHYFPSKTFSAAKLQCCQIQIDAGSAYLPSQGETEWWLRNRPRTG